MTQWQPVILAVLALLSTVGAGGGLVALLNLKATKRNLLAAAEAAQANTTTVLTKSALDLLTPLREEAAEARTEVKKLRTEVRELTALLHRWRAAILSPTVTREQLHALVATDHNGTGID